MKKVLAPILTVLFAVYGCSNKEESLSPFVPIGWHLVGTGIKLNKEKDNLDGRNVNVVHLISNSATRVGIAQRFLSNNYKGKRIEFSAFIKSSKLNGNASLIIEAHDGNLLLAKNQTNPDLIRGTLPWKQYTVDMDVPENGNLLVVKATVFGNGSISIAGADFKIIGKRNSLTGQLNTYQYPLKPLNLSLAMDKSTNTVLSGWNFNMHNRLVSATIENDKGNRILCIQPTKDHVAGYAILSQIIKSDSYAGSRVAFSADIKSKNSEDSPSLWVKAGDGRNEWVRNSIVVSSGTNDWKRYTAAVDVPELTKTIEFGFDYHGKGTLWFRKFDFANVNSKTQLQQIYSHAPSTNKEPVDMDFSDGAISTSVFSSGWNAGDKTSRISVVNDNSRDNPRVVQLESNNEAWLMQSINADKYKGMRVKFSAYVKSENLEKPAELWLTSFYGSMLAAYNVPKPGFILGTTPWTKYEAIIDVPNEPNAIVFGFAMPGKGKIWLTDLEFSKVGGNTPLSMSYSLPGHPVNLDLSEWENTTVMDYY